MATLKQRLPPLSCLIAFEAASRHGNFSRAAEELASTQSAVSRQIKQLEDFYGTKLFERRHRDVALSEPGNYLAEIASATLGEVALASDHLRARRDSLNMFRIQIDAEHASSALIPLFQEFERTFPSIELDIMITANPQSLRFGTFDISFHSDVIELKHYERTPISDDWIVPVCSPEYAESLPSPCTGNDIAGARLLHYRNPLREYTNWQTYLRSFGIEAPATETGPIFSQYCGCFDSAERGAGIALGWYSQAKARLDAGRLVRVSDLCMPLPENFAIYTDNSSKRHPLTERIIAFFRKRVNLSLEENQYRAR